MYTLINEFIWDATNAGIRITGKIHPAALDSARARQLYQLIAGDVVRLLEVTRSQGFPQRFVIPSRLHLRSPHCPHDDHLKAVLMNGLRTIRNDYNQ